MGIKDKKMMITIIANPPDQKYPIFIRLPHTWWRWWYGWRWWWHWLPHTCGLWPRRCPFKLSYNFLHSSTFSLGYIRLHFKYISNTFWLHLKSWSHFKHISVTFQIHFKHISVTFQIHYKYIHLDYISVTFWKYLFQAQLQCIDIKSIWNTSLHPSTFSHLVTSQIHFNYFAI